MLSYLTVWKRVKGDDTNLLLKRRFFGIWQKVKFYNNEVYRVQNDMNELVEKFEKKYATYKQLTKERTRINNSIEKAVHEEDDVGYKEHMSLPFFRKDNKPMERPPQTWLKFARVIKGMVPGTEVPGCDVQVVELDDSVDGGKDYEIRRVNNNQNNNKRNRNNQQNNNNQR